jgi:hypothetical protein
MLRPKRIVPRREAVPDPSADNPLHPVVGRFLEWTLAVGLAAQTAAIRRAALERFILWCDVNDVSAPGSITRERVEQYQLSLARFRKQSEQYSSTSRCSTIASDDIRDSETLLQQNLRGGITRLKWPPEARALSCPLNRAHSSGTVGWGVAYGVGVVVQGSTGWLCSGGQKSLGAFLAGGGGPFGEGNVSLGDDGAPQYGRGLGGAGGGAAGGASACFTQYWCNQDPPECRPSCAK